MSMYSKYIHQKEALVDHAIRFKKYAEDNLSFDTRSLELFQNELKEMNFKVLCLGDFSSGKSTFINNFFLEEKIKLPVKATTTTARLTIVKYGEVLKVSAIMANRSKKEIYDDIETSLKEMVAAKGSQLEDVKLVEVEIPSDMLKEGVVIVDSPGLNDPDLKRMDVTYDFLKQADCILYFLNVQQAWKKTEKEFLEQNVLNREDLDKIFFILNYWDILDDEDEREETLEFVNGEIQKSLYIVEEALHTTLNVPPIIPISAKTKENFDQLKSELENYLVNKQAQEILETKKSKHNAFVREYADELKKLLRDLQKDQKMKDLDQKKIELSYEELDSDLKEKEKKLRREVARVYEAYLDNVDRAYENGVYDFQNYIDSHFDKIKKDNIEDYFRRAEKNIKLKLQKSIDKETREFSKKIVEIAERESFDIFGKDICNLDHAVLEQVIFETKKDGMKENQHAVDTVLASGTIIAAGASGIGATIATASTGLLASIGIGATPVATALATFAPPVAGIFAVGLGLKKIFDFNKWKNNKSELIEDTRIKLEESYSAQVKNLRDQGFNIESMIVENILDELKKQKRELDKRNEALFKMRNDLSHSIEKLNHQVSEIRSYEVN